MPLFESNTIAFENELIDLNTATPASEVKGFIYDGKGQWVAIPKEETATKDHDVIVGDTMTPFFKQDFRVMAHVHGVSGVSEDTGTVEVKVYTGDTKGAINTVLFTRELKIKEMKAGSTVLNYMIDDSARRYIQLSYTVKTKAATGKTKLRMEIVPGYIV